jgi:hypothetical protein
MTEFAACCDSPRPQTPNTGGFDLVFRWLFLPQNWGPGGGSARILHPYPDPAGLV